jgi:hypothetical protein
VHRNTNAKSDTNVDGYSDGNRNTYSYCYTNAHSYSDSKDYSDAATWPDSEASPNTGASADGWLAAGQDEESDDTSND